MLLLTGAAKTQDQVKKGSAIAAASASGAKVVNVIQPDHMTYNVPPQEPQRAG